MTQTSPERTTRNLDKLKKPSIALIGLVALSGCAGEADTTTYEEDIVPDAIGITICDGANIRDAPYRTNNPDIFDEGVVVHTVDLGDAPKDTCVDVPATNVYHVWEENNGTWYGVTESDLANGLDVRKFDASKTEEIYWINGQRSSPIAGEL